LSGVQRETNLILSHFLFLLLRYADRRAEHRASRRHLESGSP